MAGVDWRFVSMRQTVPILLVLALGGVGAWLLLRGGDEAAEVELDVAPPPTPPAQGGTVELTSAKPLPAPGSRGSRASSEPVIIDPRTIPIGPLEVVVLGPDDLPIPHDDVRVTVEPGKGSKGWHTTPLLNPDPVTLSWKGDDIFAGPVRVRISGDTLVAKDVETVVTTEAGEPLRVHVDRAGALEYSVTRYGAEPPTEVKLKLLDAAGKAVLVGYQVRTETVLTQPLLVREIKQGPKGIVFGIPPGRYTLSVTSDQDDSAEAQVDVETLKTLPVALELRR